MAGIAVSISMGVMKPVLAKLGALMGDEYKQLKGLRKEVSFLERELSAMNALLEKMDAADELDPQSKNWRKDIIEMSYDIEDYIDHFVDHIGESEDKVGILQKASHYLKTFKDRRRLANQFQEIKTLVIEASERRKRYLLDECISHTNPIVVDPRLSALYTETASLVGVSGQKEELVKWIMDEEQQIKVMSIVGLGGLGKTTLASEVHREVGAKFNYKAFVSISQKPDMMRLLNSILSQLEQQGKRMSSHVCEMDLINNIREHLQDKRYFVIVDDLWNIPEWNTLSCAFPKNNQNSRVIITTRNEDVARAYCRITSEIVDLPCLSHLLVKGHPELPQEIGKVKSLRTLDGFCLSMSSLESIKDLGQLSNLTYLSINSKIYWGRTPLQGWMDALSSSLEKLGNLKYLIVDFSDVDMCTDALNTWVSAPFCHLERLDLPVWMLTRVPRWIGDLHNLCELSLWVEHIGEEDVGVIGKLPSLVQLYLRIPGMTSGSITVGGSTGFRFLKNFDFDCDGMSCLKFEAMAMPSLVKLRLILDGKRWDKGTPIGLQHLSSLKEIHLRMTAGSKLAWDAFQKAADAHPGGPAFTFVHVIYLR
ncbi:hypothetical protein PR202_ga30797 [Eleusine coracana subsp. coracana]|uniref:Uncharacterized protein n=1 Tax=Eleusine coracana subsp. coracana TaxID=191504 RepID=A0AAV5DQ90_ELECO|nr:hypothetical protein PR202_ga30797 [Eleusine coracana subsp. coracana]